ncbi:MAG TPA: alginate export family protein, partial [Terriglobales bacterium]|nr:alginate export family protein [Terriglobales bacterium]
MQTYVLLMLVVLISAGTAPGRLDAQRDPDSGAAAQPTSARKSPGAGDRPEWLFPVARLNESLPTWLRIGGEYRDRLEGPIGIGYTGVRDFYLLGHLRASVTIQPRAWLLFRAGVQDARIFFNHHTPDANPFKDTWTLWEGYTQVGSSTEGWVDLLGGRQVLRFGDERVIGPSDWLNVGRTFNAARADLHHPGYIVSVFGSSVVPGDNSDLHGALPGNNLF